MTNNAIWNCNDHVGSVSKWQKITCKYKNWLLQNKHIFKFAALYQYCTIDMCGDESLMLSSCVNITPDCESSIHILLCTSVCANALIPQQEAAREGKTLMIKVERAKHFHRTHIIYSFCVTLFLHFYQMLTTSHLRHLRRMCNITWWQGRGGDRRHVADGQFHFFVCLSKIWGIWYTYMAHTIAILIK